MSAEKRTRTTVAPIDGLVLGGEPRVELLPPEVGLRAKQRNARRLWVFALVLVLALVAAGYGLAQAKSAAAQIGLANAQAKTQELLLEQQKYAEASSTGALVAGIKDARTLGASTEILWLNIIPEVNRALPPGVAITSATITGRAPWELGLLPNGALRENRIATVSFVVGSSSVFDATAIARALATEVVGFADSTPDALSRDQATGVYSTTITLNVNELALSGRFATDSEGSK